MALFKKKQTENADVTIADNGAVSQDDVKAILEKYDNESRTRRYEGIPKKIVSAFLMIFALLAVVCPIVFNMDQRLKCSAFVGCVIISVFLLYPASKNKRHKVNYVPFYDVILMVLGAVSYFYFTVNYQRIIDKGIMIGTAEIVFGIIGTVVLFEACRRVVGLPILFVSGGFLAYAFLSGKTLFRTTYEVFYTTNGIIGTPTSVCLSTIIVFVLFGSFLEKTGISEFFIKIANSIAGSSSGGPAKVAVISSALCGMVSGSSVANTVTTGSVTIPLMKKTGYKPEFAAAVEASASTGGQIMPPIMGAAAFIMAEMSGVPYSTIALRAILPAFLYFAGIFIMIHLEAKKLGLNGIPRSELPNFFKLVISKGYLLIPLIALIVMAITGMTMSMAALVSILLVMTIDTIGRKRIYMIVPVLAFIGLTRVMANPSIAALVSIAILVVFCLFAKETREKLKNFGEALEAGCKSVIAVAAACAIAGIIAGVISMTGLGNILITAIVKIAGNAKIVALFLTMLTCIVLGMGVPTTANFMIMATTCAPILISGMNIDKIAAFMFVFYFGIVADITPPVALAAYAGSAIAKSNPMKTGFTALKLAIAAFIVPYIFALNPAMLFIDTSALEVVQIIITSFVGLFGVSAALEGYLFKKINPVLRIISAAGGLCLIYPGLITDIVGTVAVLGVFAYQYFSSKKGLVKNA